MRKQFFLSTALALTIGGFLLIWESPPESFLKPQTGKVEKLPSADSYMREIISFKFSATGARQFTLSSDNASYYNNKSLLVVENPKLNAAQTSNLKTIKIMADKGHLFADKQTLELLGNVDARWNTEEGNNHLTAGKITYLIPSDIARAEDGFKLKTPQAQLTGEILSTDLHNGITNITSKVRAVYEPR